jgi:hypothetical protein
VLMLLRIFTFTLFQALEPRSFYSHQSSGTNIHKANKQAYTKNKAPIKKETLKERTKGHARLNRSLKNTKRAWKRKAWLTLKRGSRKTEQGPERSHWDRARFYWLRKRKKHWNRTKLETIVRSLSNNKKLRLTWFN